MTTVRKHEIVHHDIWTKSNQTYQLLMEAVIVMSCLWFFSQLQLKCMSQGQIWTVRCVFDTTLQHVMILTFLRQIWTCTEYQHFVMSNLFVKV